MNRDPSLAPVALEEANRDCTAILIPECDNDAEALAYLKPLKPKLLEMELEAWIRDKQLWPVERTTDLFDEWFEFETHSMVWDAAEGVIAQEITSEA